MPEQPDAANKSGSPSDSSIDPLIKAYIDAEIEKTREHESGRKKKWKNSWRSASPITKGSFYLAASIAVATIGNTIIAIRSLNLSRRSLVDVQRAVVSADTFTTARQLGKDGQIDGMQFTVGWKNSGTTATKNMVYWGNWRIEPFNTKIDKTFNFSDIWAPTGEKVPYTHGFATTQKPIPYYPIVIPRTVISAVVDEKIELVFWGRATYNDVFEDTGTGIHTSEYCLIVMGFDGVNPFDAKAESGTTYPRFLNCPVHNCHDDECRVN